MNYIKQLKTEIENKNEAINTISEIENNLRAYLTSDKFSGFENNFVNPKDVINYIDQIRTILLSSKI